MRVALVVRVSVLLLAVAALAGCTRDVELKRTTAKESTHVSPPPVAVPRLPAGSFDQARAHSGQLKAAAARLSGDLPAARHSAETAVADWPDDLDAWAELAADCRGAGDIQCALYADFFHAKIEFVDTLPPRVAVLGFASIAAGSVGTRVGDYVYDRRTLDTALRIASFYDERDVARPAPPRPVKPAP